MKPADNRDPQTYAIIGAAMEIHRQLGHGFLEAVYQGTAVVEFPAKDIPFVREAFLPIQTPSLQYKRLVWGYENPKSV